MSFMTILSFILVGACWGCTTPFIKNGTSADRKESGETTLDATARGATKDSTKDNTKNIPTESNAGVPMRRAGLSTLLEPLRGLASVQAAVPFLLNQSGSLLYYYLLGSQEISMAVPVCNALTFVFTAATAMWLGEEVDRPVRNVAGMALVLFGIAVCVASKIES